MTDSIAINTGHATIEAFLEEFAQRCDENYLVLDFGSAADVGASVEFALYLEDGSPVFFGVGQCVEASDNGDEVDPAYRYRVVLGALELDEDNQNIRDHILAARGDAPASAAEEDEGDAPLAEEPTSFVDDSAFVDAGAASTPASEAPGELSSESTSLVDADALEVASGSLPPAASSSLPPVASVRPAASVPPQGSVPPAALADQADADDDSSTRELDLAAASNAFFGADESDPATSVGSVSDIPPARVSTPPRSVPPRSVPPVSEAPRAVAAEPDSGTFDLDVVESSRFSGPPLSAPPPSEVSAKAPLPARPESGLRRPSIAASWSPVAEPVASLGASSGLFLYDGGVLPLTGAPARPRGQVARVVPAKELVDMAPAFAGQVDEDNATSEIDINSL